jgi:FkbM family methyltransferase
MTLHKYSYYLSSVVKLLTGVREKGTVLRIFLHLPAPENKIISLRKEGLQFQVRGAMDIWSIKETFLDRFYEKHGVPIQGNWAIIDIGAGIGEYTLLAAAGKAGNQVHAYEPFPESFALLHTNLAMNQVEGVQVFAEAVGGQPGTAILDLTRGEPLQYSTESKTTSPDAIHVPTITLEQALARLGRRCQVLKLDCEGAEYAILFNAPRAALDWVDHIVMEYHDKVTAFSHRDLVDFLQSQGFQVETTPNIVHAELGYLHAFKTEVSSSAGTSAAALPKS